MSQRGDHDGRRDLYERSYDQARVRADPRGGGATQRDDYSQGGEGRGGRDRYQGGPPRGDYSQGRNGGGVGGGGGRDRLQEVRNGGGYGVTGGSDHFQDRGGGGGRDRLQEARAGPQHDDWRGGQPAESLYPPRGAVGASYRPQRPPDRNDNRVANSSSAATDQKSQLASFFDEVDGVQRGIDKLNRNMQRIQSLQSRALTATASSESRAVNAELDELNDETSTLLQTLRTQLRQMSNATKAMPATAETHSRQGQQASLARKLVDAANAFQRLQSDFKAKSKVRLEREIRVARPDATPQEIERAIESGSSGFTQQLLSSRVADQRRALQDVQNRHEQIQKIERSMEELFSLFQEMQTLLEVQQVTINNIEENAEAAVVDLEAGSKEMTKAIEYRKSSRKKAWYIVAIVIVILIILAIVLYVEVIQPILNKKDSK